MKKTTFAIAAIATAIIIAAAFTSMYYGKTSGNNSSSTNALKLPSGSVPQWQIQVSGDFSQQESISLSLIAKMPLTDVVVTSENATYRGVALNEFLNQTGILWDAGPLTIVGADGQHATLNTYQAWNSTYFPYSYQYNVIVLAFIKNGQWLSSQDGGPVKLIAPHFPSSSQVAEVNQIQSQPWTVSITGEVANPFELTGKNITSFQPQTLHGAFNPGDAPNVTADWTGIPILNLLQAAKASSGATEISVVGVDGYTQNFTLAEVRDGAMMLGYQMNGQYLPTGQGGAFRLFAPTPEYKWGQYWVKWVAEIYVC